MSGYVTLSGFYAKLRNSCDAAGGQTKWANAHGISPAYVSDVLHARKDPGQKMLAAFGLRPVTLFVAAQQEESVNG